MKIALLFLSLLVLSSCARFSKSPTPYQARAYQGGYTDLKLSKNTYQVSFAGNGYTSGERVQNYLLRRCSEISVNNGYSHFRIIDKEGGPITKHYQAYGGQLSSYTTYKFTARIELLKEDKTGTALEAKTILSQF